MTYFDDQPPAFDETQALLPDKTTLNGLKFPRSTGGGRMHDCVKAAALLKEKVAEKGSLKDGLRARAAWPRSSRNHCPHAGFLR